MSPFLELEAKFGPADDWPAKSPKDRLADFNKLLRAIVREMAALRNNCAVAYTMDDTRLYLEPRWAKPADHGSGERFEKAKVEFKAMSPDRQDEWLQKASRYRPSLATLVARRW